MSGVEVLNEEENRALTRDENGDKGGREGNGEEEKRVLLLPILGGDFDKVEVTHGGGATSQKRHVRWIEKLRRYKKRGRGEYMVSWLTQGIST